MTDRPKSIVLRRIPPDTGGAAAPVAVPTAAPVAVPTAASVAVPTKKTRKRSRVAKSPSRVLGTNEPAPKKVKTRTTYGIQLGVTPFPDWAQPTEAACEEVHNILTKAHKVQVRPDTMPEPSQKVAGCGEVPSVLDAVLRTVLSGATTVSNAGLSLEGLIDKYGAQLTGIDKNSPAWDRVRESNPEEIAAAIVRGGLANVKAKNIHKILNIVHAENMARRAAAGNPVEGAGPSGGAVITANTETSVGAYMDRVASAASSKAPAAASFDDHMARVPAAKEVIVIYDSDSEPDDPDHETTQALLSQAKPGEEKPHEMVPLCPESDMLSLDYLHNLSPPEVMAKLTEFPGVGVKTAACIMLFCLKLPVFAVDTHVHRMSQWLGWIPPTADAVKAFAHLDVRIPDKLKYALHQNFLEHGKECPRCRADTKSGTKKWDESSCVLEKLVDRIGKKTSTAPSRPYSARKWKLPPMASTHTFPPVSPHDMFKKWMATHDPDNEDEEEGEEWS